MTKRKNHSTVHARTVGQIIDGYLLAAQARQLSAHTIADYNTTFRKLIAFVGDDKAFIDIDRTDIERFLANQEGKVSKKTILNYHTGLSALWTWTYDEGLALTHVLRSIERPKPEKRAIRAYSKADVKAMLGAISFSPVKTRRGLPGQRSMSNQERNRAIILILLDTGLRAEELCTLTVRNVDMRNHRIMVFGKGDKERIIPISSRTGSAIWKYWSQRSSSGMPPPEERAFTTDEGRPLDRGRLLHQVVSIGRRAGVMGADCHRFRHTFAINYLRNGGDVYTLQAILGHATLEMCRTYLMLAQSDAETAHRKASPVTNWGL